MAKKSNERDIQQYDHRDKDRVNNPHVGLVNEKTDPDYGQVKKTYQYDPHLDPQLQWAGKAEHTSFEVPTVSLHVHERIDAKTIIETVRQEKDEAAQLSLFHEEKKPLREAIEFYKHREGWTNRLIAGDSLLVMNSLLEKEGMAGKVQMVYFDPPYGIKYGSNFQPFTDKRDVKDGKDEDLTQEPEMIKAFRDTWELGIHSYLTLTYLRDRLLLAKEMLHESGSIFVQISDENVHRVRNILDEVFGELNFVSLISISKTTSSSSDKLASVNDYLIWYCKGHIPYKFRPLFFEKELGEKGATGYTRVRLPNGNIRSLKPEERDNPEMLPQGSKICMIGDITSQRPAQEGDLKEFELDGRIYTPGKGTFKTNLQGLKRLAEAGRLYGTSGEKLGYIRFLDDFPAFPISNVWTDTVGQNQFGGEKTYVVQTGLKVIQRCLLMTTDPGDLVLDITCGSGTTAFVAEQWGRRCTHLVHEQALRMDGEIPYQSLCL